ncbi:hypothetical protein [Romboutsia sp.]|uniref:hypothetical protein n=1 Tax=Romboutsia sp. TaxID=1965302 RepID=UPI002B588246|nr:hypothetical protein [Romboutsia sp.]HSQ90299.1 hypothetical protein [Romboutsia sp.]
MSLETPINYNCNIKCPNCRHQFLYDFKIDDIDKVNSSEKSQGIETKYKFISYLICKNPICNYDIEIKGDVLEYPENSLNSIEITHVK